MVFNIREVRLFSNSCPRLNCYQPYSFSEYSWAVLISLPCGQTVLIFWICLAGSASWRTFWRWIGGIIDYVPLSINQPTTPLHNFELIRKKMRWIALVLQNVIHWITAVGETLELFCSKSWQPKRISLPLILYSDYDPEIDRLFSYYLKSGHRLKIK